MSIEIQRGSHSATVELSMRANGRSVSLSQIGPEFVILNEPEEIARQKASIVATIDGSSRQWDVMTGLQDLNDLRRVPIADVE